MPRFFFHIYDEIVVRDDEGIELPGLDAARAAAVEGARALMSEQVRAGRLALHHRLEVVDEQGDILFVLPFGDALRIEA